MEKHRVAFPVIETHSPQVRFYCSKNRKDSFFLLADANYNGLIFVSYEINELLNERDEGLVKMVLQLHPNSVEKIGPGVKGIRVNQGSYVSESLKT